MKNPENLCDVKCFLGMLGYYRCFVHEFAKLTEPPTYLLCGKVTFKWGEEQNNVYNILRKVLSSKPILAYLNFNQEFIIQTDASLKTVSDVLSQISSDN